MLHRLQQKYTNWILHSVPQCQDIQHPQPTQCNAIRYAERHPYSNAQGSDFSLIAPDSNAQGQFKQDKNENRKRRKPRNATTNKTKWKHVSKTKHKKQNISHTQYVLLDTPGCLLDTAGCSCVLLGVCWMLLGAAGCCWVLLGAAGCCWVLMPTESSWVPPWCLLAVSWKHPGRFHRCLDASCK